MAVSHKESEGTHTFSLTIHDREPKDRAARICPSSLEFIHVFLVGLLAKMYPQIRAPSFKMQGKRRTVLIAQPTQSGRQGEFLPCRTSLGLRQLLSDIGLTRSLLFTEQRRNHRWRPSPRFGGAADEGQGRGGGAGRRGAALPPRGGGSAGKSHLRPWVKS